MVLKMVIVVQTFNALTNLFVAAVLALYIEHNTFQKALADSTQRYEKKIANLIQQVNDEKARSVAAEEQLARKLLGDDQNNMQISEKKEIGNLRKRIQEVSQLHDVTLNELQSLKSDYKDLLSDKV